MPLKSLNQEIIITHSLNNTQYAPVTVQDAGNRLMNRKDTVPDFFKSTPQAMILQCENAKTEEVYAYMIIQEHTKETYNPNLGYQVKFSGIPDS